MCVCVFICVGVSVTDIILAQTMAFFITQTIQSSVLFFITYMFDVSLCVVFDEPHATVCRDLLDMVTIMRRQEIANLLPYSFLTDKSLAKAFFGTVTREMHENLDHALQT